MTFTSESQKIVQPFELHKTMDLSTQVTTITEELSMVAVEIDINTVKIMDVRLNVNKVQT